MSFAGATIRVQPGSGAACLQISMNILEGSIPDGSIAGVRVDLPIQPPGQPTAYPQSASYFFHDAASSVSPQFDAHILPLEHSKYIDNSSVSGAARMPQTHLGWLSEVS